MLFPHPLGPTNAKVWPGFTSKFIPCITYYTSFKKTTINKPSLIQQYTHTLQSTVHARFNDSVSKLNLSKHKYFVEFYYVIKGLSTPTNFAVKHNFLVYMCMYVLYLEQHKVLTYQFCVHKNSSKPLRQQNHARQVSVRIERTHKRKIKFRSLT